MRESNWLGHPLKLLSHFQATQEADFCYATLFQPNRTLIKYLTCHGIRQTGSEASMAAYFCDNTAKIVNLVQCGQELKTKRSFFAEVIFLKEKCKEGYSTFCHNVTYLLVRAKCVRPAVST
jgi:hypothetical protein